MRVAVVATLMLEVHMSGCGSQETYFRAGSHMPISHLGNTYMRFLSLPEHCIEHKDIAMVI